MTYLQNRPPVKRQSRTIDGREDGRRAVARELPNKLSIWQAIGVWLSVIMLLPFVIFLLGLLSMLIGVEDIVPPDALFSVALFTLLLATIFSSILAGLSGVLFLLVHRPRGEDLRVTLGLLAVVTVVGLLALYSLLYS